MRVLERAALVLAVVALLACKGSEGTAPDAPLATATALSYADSGSPAQWRLAANAASTPTHLVLDLLAPTGTSGMGVTLILTADPARAKWGGVDGTSLVASSVYTGTVLTRASRVGGDLRIFISQENPAPPVTYGTAPVLSVALDLVPGAPTGPVTLAAAQGGHLAAPQTLPEAITVQLGALAARTP